jgi:hypothetical protein
MPRPGGAGGLRPPTSGPASGVQAVFPAVLSFSRAVPTEGNRSVLRIGAVDDQRAGSRRNSGSCGRASMRCWSAGEGERGHAACRSRPASPCSLHVRRDRSGSRRNPRYIRTAGRVVGRDRVAPAVSRHHGQRAGAGVCARHSLLAAFAATPTQAVAPETSPGALNKRNGPGSMGGGRPAFVELLTAIPGAGRPATFYVKRKGRRASRWAAAIAACIAASAVCRRRSRASCAAAISAGVAIGVAGLCCDAHAARSVKQGFRILRVRLKQGASNKQ